MRARRHTKLLSAVELDELAAESYKKGFTEGHDAGQLMQAQADLEEARKAPDTNTHITLSFGALSISLSTTHHG